MLKLIFRILPLLTLIGSVTTTHLNLSDEKAHVKRLDEIIHTMAIEKKQSIVFYDSIKVLNQTKVDSLTMIQYMLSDSISKVRSDKYTLILNNTALKRALALSIRNKRDTCFEKIDSIIATGKGKFRRGSLGIPISGAKHQDTLEYKFLNKIGTKE